MVSGAFSTVEICRRFYEEYGAKMIRDHFPEYENRIAAGLVGEGSECFGYDDGISRDHDFGLGFCMWLCKEDAEKIGPELAWAYEELLKTEGAEYACKVWENESLRSQSGTADRLSTRRGVMEIASFYGNILRLSPDLSLILDRQYWVYAEPRFLATAVNGQVFRDDLGLFSSVRKAILDFYPAPVFRLKLAEQLHLFSHGGQSNYPRMMARKDHVAARLCIDQTIQSAMNIAFLLARKYPPYYKWIFRALKDLPVLPGLPPLLEELVRLPVQAEIWETLTYTPTVVFTQDPVIRVVEEMAALFVQEMNRQNLIKGSELFLESYVPGLADPVRQR